MKAKKAATSGKFVTKTEEVPMSRFNIDTAAMLVEFNAPCWTARKLDRATSDEVITNKNAQAKDAARVNKHLLAGRNELEVINKHVSAVRLKVHQHTLPWSDSGQRLLPVVHFAQFNERMQKEEERFWDLVDAFELAYPTLITAQAMSLGDMFKRSDYPDPAVIRSKFAFRVTYVPVPTSGDFRVDIGDAAQQELRRVLARVSDERVEAAMADVRGRLKEHLERMADRLAVDLVDGEEKGRTFRDSLVVGGLELCELAKALNIVKDQTLEGARKELHQILVGVTPDELRKNKAVREDVKQSVDAILSKFTF